MREILIFLGGAMCGSTVAFFTLCLLGGIRLRENNSKRKRKGEEGESDV